MKDTLCIGGGHSHHQFGVILVGFHAIMFTVHSTDCGDTLSTINEQCFTEPYKAHELFMNTHTIVITDTQAYYYIDWCEKT